MKKVKIVKVALALLGIAAVLACTALPVFAEDMGEYPTGLLTVFPGLSFSVTDQRSGTQFEMTDIGTGYATGYPVEFVSTDRLYQGYTSCSLEGNTLTSVAYLGDSPADTRLTELVVPYVPPVFTQGATLAEGDPLHLIVDSYINIITWLSVDAPAPPDLYLRMEFQWVRYIPTADGVTTEIAEGVTTTTAIPALKGSSKWLYRVPGYFLLDPYRKGAIPIPDPGIPLSPILNMRMTPVDYAGLPYDIDLFQITTLSTQRSRAYTLSFWNKVAVVDMGFDPIANSFHRVEITEKIENINIFEFLVNATRGFFTLEIFPGVSVGVIFGVVFGLVALFAILRFFAGG